jgi:hypothetical protein
MLYVLVKTIDREMPALSFSSFSLALSFKETDSAGLWAIWSNTSGKP